MRIDVEIIHLDISKSPPRSISTSRYFESQFTVISLDLNTAQIRRLLGTIDLWKSVHTFPYMAGKFSHPWHVFSKIFHSSDLSDLIQLI